ncbi:MAG: TonB-dependent siderophore receptor [Collimonas sp.]
MKNKGKFKGRCVSRIIYATIGVAGMAMPFADAAADDAAGSSVVKTAGDSKQIAFTDQDTLPMTKNVVSGKEVENAQDGYADAIKNVAGVSSNNAKGSANDSVKIRGIQLNLFTDYRLNGGLPITGVISFPTEDKERIEALKGANALMFGIASPAGIVNLVTKRATDKDINTLTLSGNSFGQYGSAVDLGRKFGDEKQFGLRVNLAGSHLENGVEGGNGHGLFGSVAADWKATDRLSFQFDYENYRKDVVEQASVSLSPVNPKTGTIPVPRVPDPTNLLSGSWDIYHPRTENVQLRADYKITNDWKFTGEVSRSHSERSRLQDRIDIGNNLISGWGANNVSWIHNNYTTEFEKVELLGKFLTGSLRHELTLGVSSTDRTTTTSTINNVQPRGQQQNIYNPVVLAPPILPTGPLAYTLSTGNNTGIYAYDTVSIGADWKVLMGLRETNYTFENQLGRTTGKTASPAVGLLYDIARDTTVYASYMKGLEEGATAPTNAQTKNSGMILPPGVASQTEIGIRTTFFKGITASAAYFSIERPNAVTDLNTGIFANAGTNKYRGIETTLSADINRWWTVNASGQYLHVLQNSLTNINGLVPENTPRFVGNLSVTHRSPLVQGLTLTAGTSYVSSRFINPQDQGVIPAVTLFSAGAGYATKIGGHRTTFQLSVDNIANKRYWNSVTTGTYGAGMDRSFRFNAKIDY